MKILSPVTSWRNLSHCRMERSSVLCLPSLAWCSQASAWRWEICPAISSGARTLVTCGTAWKATSERCFTKGSNSNAKLSTAITSECTNIPSAQNFNENFYDRYPDKFLKEIAMEADQFWTDIFALLLTLFILRLACYFILKWRIVINR